MEEEGGGGRKGRGDGGGVEVEVIKGDNVDVGGAARCKHATVVQAVELGRLLRLAVDHIRKFHALTSAAVALP